MNRALRALTVPLALSGAMAAEAASFVMDQSNELADGLAYLGVAIEETPGGAITFAVDVDDTLFPDRVGAFGIKTFAFNLAPGITLAKSNITVAGRAADTWTLGFAKNLSEFGTYDVVLDFDKVKEAGESEKSWPDPLGFSITGIVGDTVASYALDHAGVKGGAGYFFAAHVAGFAPSDPSSAWFAGSASGGTPTEVPIPAAFPLFGSALLGLAFLIRRSGRAEGETRR